MRPFHPNHPLYERLRTLRGAVIVIEGIIGSGKTSLGKKLTQMIAGSNIPCKFFEEEVNDELLALFLKDMKKYAFTFQLFMLANRQKVYRQAHEYARRENGVAIVDRSLHGDIAFASMHVDMGNISQDEWKVYENIVETTSSSLLEPTVIIYLEVDGEVAMERIKRRDRGDEKSSYTLDYLHELDISYKVSMQESPNTPVYLDWNDERTLTEDELLDVLNNVNL